MRWKAHGHYAIVGVAERIGGDAGMAPCQSVSHEEVGRGGADIDLMGPL